MQIITVTCLPFYWKVRSDSTFEHHHLEYSIPYVTKTGFIQFKNASDLQDITTYTKPNATAKLFESKMITFEMRNILVKTKIFLTRSVH